jgi:PPK2 family polyphosphate:nucleotide phosphotransferase
VRSAHLAVRPGHQVDLTRADPASTAGAPGDRSRTERAIEEMRPELADLQGRLWAEATRSVLVVLQGIDASGKDGTISHVLRGLNPLGTRAYAFKEPTPLELAHDFLWRLHARVPAAGEIVAFNRSHYEDVLAARVRRLVAEDVWRERYRHINDFEALLDGSGTAVVKFFLHISREEQARRLEERRDRPDKRWKWQASDLADTALWDDYAAAFTDMLERTSTENAPWYLVPSDRKWYRNWVVMSVLLDRLRELDPRYPGAAGRPGE